MKRKDDPEDFDEQEVRSEDMRLCSLHHKWLKELFIAIRGNGDIKHGLEYKVQTLLDTQKVIARIMWIILLGVLANMRRVVGIPLIDHILNLAAHYKG